MSELRQDIVSGDWIILSPDRAKRPHDLVPKKKPRPATPRSSCPFEDLKKSGNWPPVAVTPEGRRWRVAVIPNKFPALQHGERCAVLAHRGPYAFLEGIGRHELVVTRDHEKNFGALSAREALEACRVFQARHRAFGRDGCSLYVSTFANWGPTAGASVSHPHYQLLALPIIPPDVAHSLHGSARYFKERGRCVHCEMLAFEKKARVRIVERNARAVALTPYVSRDPFEVRIYPARHLPYFEHTGERDLAAVASLLQSVIRRVRDRLNDPDFNFFIHTSPLKDQARYRHYHWHVEVLPKISIAAGFELSTGVDIDVVDPDRAAAILRGRKA